MTAIEAVWEHLKWAAAEYAKRDAHPDARHAETVIVEMLRAEHVTPWPPPDAVEFYAYELLALIERDRSQVR